MQTHSMDEMTEPKVNRIAPPASAFEPVWRAVNGHPARTLSALIGLYLAIGCAQAATKLLWCDELITLAIARQGSLRGIWRALAGGADPNPPLTHWLTLQATRAFGDGALAVRLPALLCVLLAILAMWTILRRWVEPGFAALGVLAFMATRGFDYAYDARSYAPLMGFSMASLALWLAATDAARAGKRWQRLALLAGMALALALGISSNYYGVLAFFPLALGEAMRALRERRFQPGAWVAMAVGASPLLAFLPLVRHNIAEFGPHAWNRPQGGMVLDSYIVLVEGIFWPVLALAIHAAWRGPRAAARAAAGERGAHGAVLEPHRAGVLYPHQARALQPHEAAALAVLILYPILGFAVAAGGAGMVSPRCVVPVCCGFGIAAALLARRVFGTAARAGVLLLAVALLWVVARESACAVVLAQQRSAFLALRDKVAMQPADRPIAVADSLFVLPLAYYSSEQVRARIVFPIDFDAIHRFEPDDSGEQNLWAGRDGVFPVEIVRYDRTLFAGREFILIARPGGWLAQRLGGDGFGLARTGAPGDDSGWQRLGGVFTPMAHQGTGIFAASPQLTARGDRP